MQPARGPARAPGSFSPLPASSTNSNNVNSSSSSPRPPPARRVESFSSDDSTPLNVVRARNNPALNTSAGTPIYASFTSQPNGSTNSLQNFSRPTLSTAQAAAKSVASAHSPSDVHARNGMPPLSLNPPTTSPSVGSFSAAAKGHSRKHSASAGLFNSTLPSTSTSNLSQVGSMVQPSPKLAPSPHRELSASQIAAQAAVMHHQNQQQAQQQAQMHAQQQHPYHQQHTRQRSQTVPTPGAEYENTLSSNKRGSSGGPLSPPLLSLTEASGPRESGFGNQSYHNGLLGSHTAAATAAANVVFPHSGQSSPKLPSQSQPAAPPTPILTNPEKPLKSEKSKVKLFSRPGKIGIKGVDPKDKPLPSPGRIGHALSSLQRGNFSTTSLDSTSQSFYSLANSSSATIKAVETPVIVEKEGKEKKHHFLSRQKHKLKDKDDYHLPLSSASSNSRPTDPSAPSSLYNFTIPPSPGPNSTFKTMSGLGHGGRSRDKKKEEKFDDAASSYTPSVGDWGGSSSLPSAPSILHDPFDSGKYGLTNMTADDAWPFLKAKLLVVFEGEDVAIPFEDFNRIVRLHIQYCIARRSPNIIVEDLRDLLHTGFGSLDYTLRNTPEDRLIPALVELWVFTYGQILHYMLAIFLPLDQEFLGCGSLMTSEQAREFWGGVVSATTLANAPTLASTMGSGRGQAPPPVEPISTVLDVRRIVLVAFRDVVILPRYEMLKAMMSRSALEFLPQSLASMALASPMPVPSPGPHSTVGGGGSSFAPPLSTSPSGESTHSYRPGTAMSLDPSMASYNSTGTTLLPESSAGSITGSRSRGFSNVSFGSSSEATSAASGRPFTPSSLNAPGAQAGASSSAREREQNVEDSKQVTDMVGRMLQCFSILASVGHQGGVQPDEGNAMVEELNKLLKLNWLGRGRTGRNRRGIVGGRVRRGTTENIREDAEE